MIDKYAAWLKQRGVNGVLVNGTTGEGVCQRVDERKRNFEEWLSSCRKYDMKCMVQVGGTAITSVHDLAEHAEEKGADAVLCLPDLFFKPLCEEDLVDYLQKVAVHCPTRPLFYYHFPAFSKVNCIQNAIFLCLLRRNSVFFFLFSVWMPRLCDLADKQIPSFNGIKFSNSDLNECVACLKPDRKVFFGSNTVFLGALAQGIDSGILVSLNVFPELAVDIFAAVRENRWADAQATQLELTKRFNQFGGALKDEFNRVNSEFECGPARKPLLNLHKN